MAIYAHTKQGFMAALEEVLNHRCGWGQGVDEHLDLVRAMIFEREQVELSRRTFVLSAWLRIGGAPGEMTTSRLQSLPDGDPELDAEHPLRRNKSERSRRSDQEHQDELSPR